MFATCASSIGVAALLTLPLSLQAQTAVAARPLGPVIARYAAPLGNVDRVIALPDGRLFVNNIGHRRLLLVDAELKTPVVVLDSVLGRNDSYGSGRRMLFPFTGDSVLFHDATANVFVVVGPRGPARTFAPPQGVTTVLLQNPFGENPPAPRPFPWFSGAMGLIYPLEIFAPRLEPVPPGAPEVVDTAWRRRALVRFDPATRAVDTITQLSGGSALIRTARGGFMGSRAFHPFYPFVDEVAVLSGGSVAVVRAREFRLEFFNRNGAAGPSIRVPHEWQRLGERERSALADSVNLVQKQLWESRVEQWTRDSVAAVASGRTGPTQVTTRTYIDGRTEQVTSPLPRPTPPVPVRAEEFPDFVPPYRPSGVLADADNRLWIRAGFGTVGDATYSVFDTRGVIVDRITIPTGTNIVGFAPGIVFLVARDAGTVQLLKARIAR